VPTAAATNETNEKMSRDKFITCVVFAGVDIKRYGKLKLPKTGKECRDNVVTLHERQGSSYDRQKDKGQTDQKSFMQKHHNKHVPCYKCGKKGHYAK
jgi:hypothetical protein